jgi:hypothetical protein
LINAATAHANGHDAQAWKQFIEASKDVKARADELMRLEEHEGMTEMPK